MSKNYLHYKAGKKSFATKGILLLIILAVIFLVILVKFARSGSRVDSVNGSPDSDEAYSIAKEFIKPTIKSTEVYFPESGYQCAQKPDSVYIIKSYAESKGSSGIKNTVTFEITLRFNGGSASDKKSWKVLGLSEN
ncbi:MAG: hypothetical protein ACXVB0_21460 [Mucilaginibacter sp.]